MKLERPHATALGTAVGLALVLAAATASAATPTVTWSCNDGLWEVAECWDPPRLPADGDTVLVPAVGGAATTLRVADTTEFAAATAIFVDNPAEGVTPLLSVEGGLLVPYDRLVAGDAGSGAVSQSGGLVSTDGGWLVLGNQWGASGSYTLSGSGELNLLRQTVGLEGDGQFTQKGGNNYALTLELGYGAVSPWQPSEGDYDLSGGTLSATDEYVGMAGNASFLHTGGTNQVGGTLYVGYAGTPGPPAETARTAAATVPVFGFFHSYELSGEETSLSAATEVVGHGTGGDFTQSGYSGNTVSGTLVVGEAEGFGSYHLDGGFLIAGNEVIGGASGSGDFVQHEAYHEVDGTLTVALDDTSSGSFEQYGGTLVAGTIQVNAGGSFTYDGDAAAELVANEIHVAPGAAFTFTGGRLDVADFYIPLLENGGGTLSPGDSPGRTTIHGSYAVTDPAATLEIEIAGLVAGSEYDQLVVEGDATLGGTLEVVLLDFLPQVGDTFDVLIADTLGGSFDQTLFPVVEGITFDVAYLDVEGQGIVRLTAVAVPEPTGLLLVATALLGIAAARRRA
ncbi:MAG: PEP-CTERM sorting domain-containing protein [Nitrospirae bacterium]|nr:MAG: PEP-CTERM sorting domain-containing protein [Nitrospirota bacterium]